MIIIKSQDGKSIVEYNRIEVRGTAIVGFRNGMGGAIQIGSYSIIRCKEVMEMIEKHIEDSNQYPTQYRYYYTRKIFKMPRE